MTYQQKLAHAHNELKIKDLMTVFRTAPLTLAGSPVEQELHTRFETRFKLTGRYGK